MKETLGSLIKRNREVKGFGLREMAKKCNMSPAYLSAIEKDQKKNISAIFINSISNTLGIPIEDLIQLMNSS